MGRTLDFLAQEMNREINTIGAKANDAVIAREVVTLKAEAGKIPRAGPERGVINARF